MKFPLHLYQSKRIHKEASLLVSITKHTKMLNPSFPMKKSLNSIRSYPDSNHIQIRLQRTFKERNKQPSLTGMEKTPSYFLCLYLSAKIRKTEFLVRRQVI